ncbi:MAG TPA: hypothetical protein PKZ65_04165 [Methanoregulaceae archaeon]|nr:hypothetical protein [Methanoregulaceae archaeon]
MTDLRSIPDDVKWKLSAQCAARIPLLYEHVFRPVVGETYDGHEQQVFTELADLAFDIAALLQLPMNNAHEIAESLHIVNAILFGPEYKEEIIEVGEDGAVIVHRRCPFLQQTGGTGAGSDGMFQRCMAFTLTSQNRFNPKYESRFVRAMCAGDRQCEIKIQVRKEEKKSQI